MKDPLRQIYLVDDDPGVLQALARLLGSAGYEVMAFTSAKGFMQAYPPDAPGCLLLDISMPEMTGMDLQRWLAATNSSLPVIFLTGQGDIPTSVRAMKAGAVDFLTKPVEEAELLQAIREASRKGCAARAEREAREAIQRRLATLTVRERQVLEGVVAGKLNKQIAGDLGTVEKTIKFHRANVMAKMGVHSLAELVRLAQQAGIGQVVQVNAPATPKQGADARPT